MEASFPQKTDGCLPPSFPSRLTPLWCHVYPSLGPARLSIFWERGGNALLFRGISVRDLASSRPKNRYKTLQETKVQFSFSRKIYKFCLSKLYWPLNFFYIYILSCFPHLFLVTNGLSWVQQSESMFKSLIKKLDNITSR